MIPSNAFNYFRQDSHRPPSRWRTSVAAWLHSASDARRLPLVIGGGVALVLGFSGIAAVLAWMPDSSDTETQISPARIEDAARVRVKCPECGVVESMREVTQMPTQMPTQTPTQTPVQAGTQADTAGGTAKADRGERAGKSIKTYEVTVRMKNGARHVFIDANPENWRTGERVTVIEDASLSGD